MQVGVKACDCHGQVAWYWTEGIVKPEFDFLKIHSKTPLLV